MTGPAVAVAPAQFGPHLAHPGPPLPARGGACYHAAWC